MKKLIILSLSLFLLSCHERSTVIIDGCEYIQDDSYNGHGYTTTVAHKGDCKNPIHYYFKKDTIFVPIKDTTNE